MAVETAKAIDKEDAWLALSKEALRQGNSKIVEMAYQRMRKLDKLSFLYFITGNIEKLQKMQKIAEHRSDNMSRFHNSLYLGNIEERVRVLTEAGQYSLAYLTAKSHGLADLAAKVLEECEKSEDEIGNLPQPGCLLRPPIPIIQQQNNWPLLEIPSGSFFGGSGFKVVENTPLAAAMSNANDIANAGGDWGEDTVLPTLTVEAVADEVAEAAWGIDEVEVEMEFHDAKEFSAPAEGTPETELWCHNSPLAADHVAAGSFESAMQLLTRQAAIINFAPLKDYFIATASYSKAYMAGFPSLPPLVAPLRRNFDETDPRKVLPVNVFKFKNIVGGPLHEAYKLTTSGKFQDAMTLFRKILQMLVLCVVTNDNDIEEHKQLIGICREYVLGLSIEKERRELGSANLKRSLELAAFFTHCQLQSVHQQLSLRSAMSLCYKSKNYLSASSFARRLLELNPATTVAQQARQYKAASDKIARDEIQLDYDPYNVFDICAATHVAIFRGSPSVQCPYCQVHYTIEFRNRLCGVCDLAQIGAAATGLRTSV